MVEDGARPSMPRPAHPPGPIMPSLSIPIASVVCAVRRHDVTTSDVPVRHVGVRRLHVDGAPYRSVHRPAQPQHVARVRHTTPATPPARGARHWRRRGASRTSVGVAASSNGGSSTPMGRGGPDSPRRPSTIGAVSWSSRCSSAGRTQASGSGTALAWNHVRANGPAVRQTYALAWDSRRQRVLLRGGQGGTRGPYLADQWIWSGTEWTEILPTRQAPAGRGGATLVDDRARARLLYFGGYNDQQLGDFWSLQDDVWTRLGSP